MPASLLNLNRLADKGRLFAYRHILGLAPDPATCPPPDDVSSLPLPQGKIKSNEKLTGFTLDYEFGNRWPHRRTMVGAQAFRFEVNGEYDCGWRLVDLAGRFLEHTASGDFDILIVVPPPQVFRPLKINDWTGERLAIRLRSTFRPDLIALSAPLNDHADRLQRLPTAWGDLYRLTRPESVFKKRILLVDWRWEKGKSMTALSMLLRRAGADVVCFAWMDSQ